jgi:hypothetical protein
MKKTLFLGFAIAAMAAGCNQAPKTASQEGVYKLDKQVITDGKTETVKTAEGGDIQYKIFTTEGYFYIGINYYYLLLF